MLLFLFHSRCRKTQEVFDKCVLDKLGQERPEVGYFTKVRVHKTERPKPHRNVVLPQPTRGPEDIDPNAPVPESTKLGSNVLY